MKLIDADVLSDKVDAHCKRHRITAYERDLIQHYLDEEMAPGVEAVPLKPLARFLTGYLYPPGMQDKIRANLVFMSTQDGAKIIAECWENFLKKKRWDDAAD